MSWHKLADEKPQKEGHYLVYHGHWVTIHYHVDYYVKNRDFQPYLGVTHWAELEPPEEEK